MGECRKGRGRDIKFNGYNTFTNDNAYSDRLNLDEAHQTNVRSNFIVAAVSNQMLVLSTHRRLGTELIKSFRSRHNSGNRRIHL